MNKFITRITLFGAIVGATIGFSSCENDAASIGSSLIQEESEVVVHNEFTVSGHTVDNSYIESRTIVQLLGDIDAKGYGKFSSDFVCQFMPASRLVTDGVTVNDIDSMKLMLAFANGGYVGDSIVPMGLEVYPLTRQLSSPIYSNFDPAEYCDLTAAPLASKMYVANAQGLNDSIQALNYREINVDLPLSLARSLFQLYLDNPSAYSFPGEFAKYFPGIYVRNSFGAGRVVQIARTSMAMYYHTTTTDSEGNEIIERHTGNYFAVTPEVISNNNINFTIDPALQSRIDDGETIIVAPVGRDVEFTFPIKEVIDYYNANRGALAVVNTLTFTIPAEEIVNSYGIYPPQNLLMVLSNKKDEFFLKNSLTDDKTSFVASYNSIGGYYKFSALRSFFVDMLDKYEAQGGFIDPADVTFTLTPVTIDMETTTSSYYSTSTYVAAITPYIGRPVMTKLDLSAADITIQFSKQSLK